MPRMLEERFPTSNMDETPAYFDICLNRTVARKRKKSVVVHTTGAENRHLTVMLSYNANRFLLPPIRMSLTNTW